MDCIQIDIFSSIFNIYLDLCTYTQYMFVKLHIQYVYM